MLLCLKKLNKLKNQELFLSLSMRKGTGRRPLPNQTDRRTRSYGFLVLVGGHCCGNAHRQIAGGSAGTASHPQAHASGRSQNDLPVPCPWEGRPASPAGLPGSGPSQLGQSCHPLSLALEVLPDAHCPDRSLGPPRGQVRAPGTQSRNCPPAQTGRS